MEINVWANKLLLDWILPQPLEVAQVVAISSGASKRSGRGWGAYANSKAALDMLIATYAEERPRIHFSSLAPGIVDTDMQEHLRTEVDVERFPSVARPRAARDGGAMPSPRKAGLRFAECLPRLLEHPFGKLPGPAVALNRRRPDRD